MRLAVFVAALFVASGFLWVLLIEWPRETIGAYLALFGAAKAFDAIEAARARRRRLEDFPSARTVN